MRDSPKLAFHHAVTYRYGTVARQPKTEDSNHVVEASNTVVGSRVGRGGKRDPYATWILRNQAADMLGCSRATLYAYERRDKLHPKRVERADQQGFNRKQWVYDPEELAKIPRIVRESARPAGWAAARCFDMCREGVALADIVIELQESPESIRTWYEQWLDMGGSRMVITPGARNELEALVGAFASVAELIERIAKIRNDAENPAPR